MFYPLKTEFSKQRTVACKPSPCHSSGIGWVGDGTGSSILAFHRHRILRMDIPRSKSTYCDGRFHSTNYFSMPSPAQQQGKQAHIVQMLERTLHSYPLR